MKTALAAVLLIGAPLLAGAIGAVAATNAPSFYAQLARPSWAPPPSVFGPVWTALYILMGVAAFLVWRAHGWHPALTLFLLHLVLNALWSWLFFFWQRGLWSSVEIVALWLVIAALVIWFLRLRPLAGVLLLPYAAWVTFATALTFALVGANPQLLR